MNTLLVLIINICITFTSAFQCILHGHPFDIPMEITGEYVRFAEEIADISYSQSETFSSVCVWLISYMYPHIYNIMCFIYKHLNILLLSLLTGFAAEQLKYFLHNRQTKITNSNKGCPSNYTQFSESGECQNISEKYLWQSYRNH